VSKQREVLMWQLSSDLLRLLQSHWQRKVIKRDALWAELLLLLNHPLYRKQLLFRYWDNSTAPEPYDFITHDGTRVTIDGEAMNYFHGVLHRRMALRKGRLETSIHHLYSTLCQCAVDQGWHGAHYQRIQNHESRQVPASHESIEAELAKQVTEAEPELSVWARTCRDRHGEMYLHHDHGDFPMPAEPVLLRLLEVLPLPLADSDDAGLLELLLSVIETLNAPYAALRRLGLRTDEWLPRISDAAEEGQSPHGMPGVNKLKELATLQQRAWQIASERSQAEPCWADAFAELRGEASSYGGFASIAQFSRHEIGMILMDTQTPYAASDADDAMQDNEVGDDHPMGEQNHAADQIALRRLIDQAFPADSLERYTADWMLLQKRRLHDARGSRQGVLHDPRFVELLVAHPSYAHLPHEELLQRLPDAIEKRLYRIIRKENQHE